MLPIGSGLVKISKLLPWDFDITYGGLTILIAMVGWVGVAIAMYLSTSTGGVWLWFIGASFALMALIYTNGPRVWRHFVGTRLQTRDKEQFNRLREHCENNLNSLVWLDASGWSGEFYIIVFLFRQDALIAKLSA